MSESAHSGKTVPCGNVLTDEDGEPITEEHEILDEQHPNYGDTYTVEQRCGTELNWEDHGRYVQHPRGEDQHGNRLEDRFTQSALRFDCPDCGSTTWMCPVCTGEDDPGAGWFRGDSSGKALACHNCNAEEAARQDRGRY